MRSRRLAWTIALAGLLAAGLGACVGKLSSTNVGDPTGMARSQLLARVDRLRPGLPADSLELLFGEARAPGQTGILGRSRLAAGGRERVVYTLGWKSDPRHQIGAKDWDEIDVAIAEAVFEDGRLVRVAKLPAP